MRFEFALDRAGLWWSGLGVSLHVVSDPWQSEEAFADWWHGVEGSRWFRVGRFTGVIGRA